MTTVDFLSEKIKRDGGIPADKWTFQQMIDFISGQLPNKKGKLKGVVLLVEENGDEQEFSVFVSELNYLETLGLMSKFVSES